MGQVGEEDMEGKEVVEVDNNKKEGKKKRWYPCVVVIRPG